MTKLHGIDTAAACRENPAVVTTLEVPRLARELGLRPGQVQATIALRP